MCGIAGIMMRNGRLPEPGVIEKMTTALGHRGPDGVGHYSDDTVSMVQTRLAIIDVANGKQPFEDAGGAVLIANGMIYNDLEIRKELDDAPYKTGSDCESALHLYRRKGMDFPHALRGMYAIALYDKAESKLILARDPFGIKQLYYVVTNDYFAFASEPQALSASGLVVDYGVNHQSRAELLQLKFTVGEETAFSDIRRILPGETVVVTNGKITSRHIRPAIRQSRPSVMAYEGYAKKLDEVLTESVQLHVRSDVPYGLFLSSGIDSSVLGTLMSRISTTPVITMTASFPGSKAADESKAARRMADAIGTDHHVIEMTREDFWNSVPQFVNAIDDPTTDAAVIPTYLLGKLARSHNLKVVLSGEGADEVFGGYSRYRRTSWLWRLIRGKARTKGTFGSELSHHDGFHHWRQRLEQIETQHDNDSWSHLQKLQAVDCAAWLPNDLLVKLDRCLMAHGVEGRVPFLDQKVAEFAFHLPDNMKVRNKYGKWLLRDWLSKNMPAAQPWAKKKGFNPPIGEWIDAYKEKLTPLVLAQPGIAEMAISDIVKKVLSNPTEHAQAAWSLVFYALWHSRHVIGLDSEGTIEDVLKAASKLH